MATPPIRGNTAAPRTGEDEGSAFERDLTVFFELKMWRWLNSLGNFTNEKSVVQRLISADVHEHLSRAVVCFRKEADFEEFDEWIRQQGRTVPYTKGNKIVRIKARTIRANVRTVSVRYVPIWLSLEEVTLGLAKYGNVLNGSRVELMVPGGHKVATERTIFTMELTGKQNVPSYVKVRGVTLSVTYQGQAKTCAGCGSTIHLAKACPLLEQRKQKSNSGAKNAGKGRPKAAPSSSTVSKPIETVRAHEVRPEERQKADQPAVPSPAVSAPETARKQG